MPKKEPALIAKKATLNVMVLQQFISNVFDVIDAKNALFGNAWMSKNETNFHGFVSGSRKATLSVGFHNSPATVTQKSNKSKTIGLTKRLNALPIYPRSNIPSMTALTLVKTTALLLS